MINKALEFLVDEVNQYLVSKTGDIDQVIYTNFFNHASGETGTEIPDGNVGCGLINIEEEKSVKNFSATVKTPEGKIITVNPSIKLNLYIMFAANRFTSGSEESDGTYLDGLEDISHIIAFFQGRHYFTPQTSPALDSSIEKLVVEMYTLPMEQQNNLWNSLHTAYLPSIAFLVRMVSIADTGNQGVGESTGETDFNLNS